MPFNIRDYSPRILKSFEDNVYLVGGSTITGCICGIILSGYLGYHRDREYEEDIINELRPLVEKADGLQGYSLAESEELRRRLEEFGHEIPEGVLIELDDLSRSEIVTALRTYRLFPRLPAEDE